MLSPPSFNSVDAPAPHVCVDVCAPQPTVAQFLVKKLERARGAADVWVDIPEVNVFMQQWTAERFDVVIQEADSLLSRHWRLPQCQTRVNAAALTETALEQESVSTMLRNATMAYRYLHRAVSHFYQRIGNKAVSAFGKSINENAGLGTLQLVRGAQTKYDVCFGPQEAAALILNDDFITELLYRGGVVRALHVVFSVLGVFHRFSEVGPLPATGEVFACLTAHAALVNLRVRAHLKKRAASELDDADVVDATPDLNSGHREEWVEELAVACHLFSPQEARRSNGLRLTDGTEPRRDDPSYRGPWTSPCASGDPTPVTSALAATEGTRNKVADEHPSVDEGDGGEASIEDSPGPVHHAAVATAHAAAEHAMAGVYEDVH